MARCAGKDPTKGDGTMKYWLSAIVAACVVLAPIASQAAAKKTHRSHTSQMQPSGEANVQRTEGASSGLHMPTAADPTGGNAAAGGNNAGSMFGSNSPADNAIGRTSGGGGYGGN
jgi:hypothetical protein